MDDNASLRVFDLIGGHDNLLTQTAIVTAHGWEPAVAGPATAALEADGYITRVNGDPSQPWTLTLAGRALREFRRGESGSEPAQ